MSFSKVDWDKIAFCSRKAVSMLNIILKGLKYDAHELKLTRLMQCLKSKSSTKVELLISPFTFTQAAGLPPPNGQDI
jgi:hypothetical protein